MGKQGRYERRPSKKNRGVKTALIVIAVILALIAAAVLGVSIYFNHLTSKITYVEPKETNLDFDVLNDLLPPEETDETEPEETAPPTTEETVPETKPMTADDILNILLIGNSSRAGEDARLADTAIVVSINKYTNTVTLTSVFRDSLVQFPTFQDANGRTRTGGKIKFTTCYNLGYQFGGQDVGWAMKVMNMTLLENFGIEIDYDFEIDFDGFIALIDKLGPLSLELTEAEAKYINESLKGYCEMVPGENEVDGYIALTYARMRHADGDSDSDIKRTARQRNLIQVILKKLTRTDIGTINSVINEVLPYISTNMPSDKMGPLVLELVPMLKDLKIESGTCPVEGTYWGDYLDIYKDGVEHSVLRFESAQQKKLMRAITEGEIPADQK